MKKLITTLQQLSRTSAIQSALSAGESRAYDNAAALAEEHSRPTISQASPSSDAPTSSPSSLQPAHRQKRRVQGGTSGTASRILNRQRITDGVLDVLRERGDWLADETLLTTLHAQGLTPDMTALRYALTSCVRGDLLERRGNMYRVAPLNP